MHRFDISMPSDQFDIELCVTSAQVFRWQRLDDGRWLGVDGENWYLVKALSTEPVIERNALVRVAETRSRCADRACNRYDVESNAPESAFSDLFRLDWDVPEIARRIETNAPELGPYLGALQGLRVMRPSDATETFFSFLCTPNNNLGRITQMVKRLAEYGPAMATVGGTTLHRFARTDAIAEIPERALRAKGFGYRAATIPAVARAVLDRGGDAWIESLKAVSYEEAFEQMVSIKGIGPKLADCIALLALHHLEAVPVDTHIWQAATRLYFPEWKDKPLNSARYREIGALLRAKLGPLAGWADQFLFVDNLLNWRQRKARK